MSKVAVVVYSREGFKEWDGMGSQESDFAKPLIGEISKRLTESGHDPKKVAWAPVYWADVLKELQEKYIEDASDANPWGWPPLRRFVVESLGDAAAYQFVEGPNSTYTQIHNKIRTAMEKMYVNDLNSTAVPLVILAHSLGSHIMSSYIWDCQWNKPTGARTGASDFERMRWLAGMVTFGSNIPLFTFAHKKVVAIELPGSELPSDVKPKAAWYNYYDKDDALGYPLKQLSDSYRDVVDEDVEINVGNWWKSLTPLSHTAYWTDKDFTKPAAEFLATFL